MHKYFWRPLRSLAVRFGLYHRLRYSKAYETILRVRNPNYLRCLHRELVFYKSALGSQCDLIFDIGANHGDKTSVFRQIANQVVAVEPDSNCFSALTTRFGTDPKIFLENIALGDEVGRTSFYIETEGSPFNTLSAKQRASRYNVHPLKNGKTVEVSIATLDDLIKKYGLPGYAKIDVEGYELQVFRGLSCEIPVLSFEANLPTFREETLEILKRFERVPSPRFNLTANNAPKFVFDAHQTGDKVQELISTMDGTFDIFVFQDWDHRRKRAHMIPE